VRDTVVFDDADASEDYSIAMALGRMPSILERTLPEAQTFLPTMQPQKTNGW